MTVHSRVSGSIYFLGRYRPCHFEADTAQALALRMYEAADGIHSTNLRIWLIQRITEGKYQLRPECTAWQADHCDRGVSFAARPHDSWLDAATDSMPPCPGLDYSRGMS